MPPLFRKGHPMGSYSGRFSFSLKEDLFMLVALPDIGLHLSRSV